MQRQRVAVAVAIMAAAWAVWLPVSAVLAPLGGGDWLVAALGVTYRAGALVCHQDPDRSFHAGVTQWPVCARCAGLYAGAAVGGIVGLWWRRRAGAGRARADERLRLARWVIVGAGVPTALLWVAEHGAGADVGNGLRFAGALPLGMAVAALVTAWIAGVAFDAPAPGSAIN